MSGNRFWTGVAFGALTGVAVAAGAYASSRGCYGYYNYTPCYSGLGFGFNGFLNSCYTGYGVGYGRTGWGPNSVIYGPDAFTAMYAPAKVMANANLGYFIA